MARTVILTDYCDVCLYGGEDRHVEASFTGDVILGGLRRNISLCLVHQEELLDPLGIVLTKWGRVAEADAGEGGVRGRPRPKTLETCRLCLKPCDNRAALASHYRRTHKTSIEDVEADLEQARFYKCADCEASFPTTQQLGGHVYNRHTRSDRRIPT